MVANSRSKTNLLLRMCNRRKKEYSQNFSYSSKHRYIILLTSEQSNFCETFTCWIWCFTWNNNNKGKKTDGKCFYWGKQIETKLFLFRQLLTSIASNSTVNSQRWLNVDVIWLACSHWLPTITVDVMVDAKSCRKNWRSVIVQWVTTSPFANSWNILPGGDGGFGFWMAPGSDKGKKNRCNTWSTLLFCLFVCFFVQFVI